MKYFYREKKMLITQFVYSGVLISATVKDTLRLPDLPGQVLEINPDDYPAYEVNSV